MTREETIAFLKKMNAAYPSYNPVSIQDTVDVWSDMLSDVSFKDAYNSLTKYIRTNRSGFAPSIGQIFACMGNVREAES